MQPDIDGLTFDPESHRYRYKGVVVPGVTTILSAVGLTRFTSGNGGTCSGSLEAARERGQAVHAAVQFDCEGRLDDETVDPDLIGYLDASRRWRSDSAFEPIALEYRLFHPVYRYAGTADKIGWLHGAPAVVDWKTGRASDCVADLQLAAYAAALRQQPPVEWFSVSPQTAIQRIAVELRDDGTYRTHRYTRPTDFTLFLNALAIYREQERRGVRERVA